jgi:hypothetical protein
MCGLLLTAQTMKAQQNMYVLDSNGAVDAISTSQNDYSTFKADSSWFTITNDGLEGTRNNLICASCTVTLAADGGIKTLGVAPEIGVCYSRNNTVPTTNDDCQILGSTMGSYTFTLASLFSGTVYYYRVYVKLGDETFYGDVCNAQTSGTKPVDNSKTINGHKFIDLDLPSGLLWAETNIGAETAADDGGYYAWGETTTKDTYNWSTYKYGTPTGGITKYNKTDSLTVLENEDDAAYVNWGTPCRMPTQAECEELCDTTNCKWIWTSRTTSSGKSIKGYRVVSVKNGNSIFLPASGFLYESSHGSGGNYWSSTLGSFSTSNAYYLNFYSGLFNSNYNKNRYFGLTVRPVAEH